MAGKTGSRSSGRVVEGLPRYLRPGGKFYALLMATDREGEEFEQRIRKWLGADEAIVRHHPGVRLAAHAGRVDHGEERPNGIRIPPKNGVSGRRCGRRRRPSMSSTGGS